MRVYKKAHYPIAYFGNHSLDAVQSCQLFSPSLSEFGLVLTVALKVNRYATDFFRLSTTSAEEGVCKQLESVTEQNQSRFVRGNCLE